MKESPGKRRSRERLPDLLAVFKDHRNMLVVLQDFPDPDAIAAAAALKELARCATTMQTSIACSGIIGRAENRALVRYMGINMLRMSDQDFDDFDVVAMVDTQPGTGNNSLPAGVTPDIVIDHHPIRPLTRKAEFHDVRRRYGSTSTILYEYLSSAERPIDIPLATALAYGIRSDTSDLGREATQADIDAFVELYRQSNKRRMGRLDSERLPQQYFGMLYTGLKNARIHGRSIVTTLGAIENPDMIGEVADLLMRNEESTWAMCCGVHADRLLVSLRTSEPDANAGLVARRAVGRAGTGGGHTAMAGGQLPLKSSDPENIAKAEKLVVGRFLKALAESDADGQALVSV